MVDCAHHWKIIRPESTQNMVKNPSAEESEIVGVELLDNPGFETAGGGGVDIWADWIESASDGALANEVGSVHSGSDAAKITAGLSVNTLVYQDVTVTAGKMYRFLVWTRGDATYAGQYVIYDQTGGADIIGLSSTGVTAATYAEVDVAFIAPVGCVTVRIYLWCPSTNTGVAYFDDVSVKEVNAGELNLDDDVLSRSTTYSKWGLYSWRMQTDGSDEGAMFALEILSNADHYVTMAVRGKLPPSWVWLLGNHYRTPILLESLNKYWNLYGSPFPAAEANGSMVLYIQQRAAGSGDFYLDGLQVEAKSGYNTTFCDGDQQGCTWLGAEHDSASERSAQSRAGGKVVDLYEEYNFVVETVVGAGAVPVNLRVAEYALLPGGELSAAKDMPRTFSLVGTIVGTSQAKVHAMQQALIQELGANTYVKDSAGYQPVRIRYTGSAVQKEIAAHYDAGLEGELEVHYGPYKLQTAQDVWEKTKQWNVAVPVRFLAPDPFWYEIGDSSALLDSNDSATLRYVAGRLRSTGQWDTLGVTSNPLVGLTYPSAFCHASDNTVYAVGTFCNFNGIVGADYIARYIVMSETWEIVGAAADVGLRARNVIEGPDGCIYICGTFVNVAGIAAADYVAKWNPLTKAWSALGTPGAGATVTSIYNMAFDSGGNLYVIGDFVNLAGVAACDYIAKWDGALWTAVGVPSVTASFPEAIVIDSEDTIYIGGGFQNFAGVADADYFAKWDGAWGAVSATVPDNPVYALSIGPDDRIYVFGNFTNLGPTERCAIWNGSGYEGMGGSADNTIVQSALAPDGSIYVAGYFKAMGDRPLAELLGVWTGAWGFSDVRFPAGTTLSKAIGVGTADPVVPSLHDIFVSFNRSGTGHFGGKVTIINDGTSLNYPVLYVKREGGTSAQLLTLRNETTGKRLFFDYELLDGETLKVDLRPKERSIVSDFFGPRPAAILAYSDFGSFTLHPGNNHITCFVHEADSPTVTAWLEYQITYKSMD